MKSILIDAGPIIALFNRRDKYHKKIIDFLKRYKGKLVTTWPVVTEVTHMLDFNVDAQIAFLEWIRRGGIEVYEIKVEDIERIIEITNKYRDVPMDFADASLIIASEGLRIREIITIDNDYYIYRTINKEMLRNIFLNYEYENE